MNRIIITASLAALALLSTGCCCHRSDSFYVAKDSQRVFKISPKLIGTWEGKLTEYASNGASGKTYDCTLEIRETETWILRGFGENKELPGVFSVNQSDRISGSFGTDDSFMFITLGSNNDIIIKREVSKAPGEGYMSILVKMHRKN